MQKAPTTVRQPPSFELTRFVWGSPDRLELSGRFIGLPDAPAGAPTLVVTGVDGVHRLAVASDSRSVPPQDGQRWDAIFVWKEPPVAFEGAQLEFGADVIVELPEPAARRTRSRRQKLEVTRERAQKGAERAKNGEDGRHEPERVQDDIVPSDSMQQLRVQAELLATQEALREVLTDLQRTQAELTRVQHDLASDRELRSADAERFQQGLAGIRDAAAQALTAEQDAAQQLGAELGEARDMIDAKDAALEELRGQLEAAAATQAKAESAAGAEIDALRDRAATLERAGKEADRLRAELQQSRTQADGARAQVDKTRRAIDEARTDAERLLGRLSAFDDAAGDDA